MSDTPRILEALTQVLDRDGRLEDDNAPFVLVRLAKQLERELNAAKALIESLEDALIEIEACCYEDDSSNLAADASWHLARKALKKLKEHNK